MRLPAAFALSLLLHALAVTGGLWRPRSPARPAPPPLQATLTPVRPPAELVAPEAPQQAAPQPEQAAKPVAPKPAREHRLVARPRDAGTPPAATNTPATAASRQIARALLYPPEAIARGLEGETVVMLFLDEAGNALAARIERSSGHAILDNAAVAAARQVRALPDGAAREIVLPVRFRLR